MKLKYISNNRMPNEYAHGLQIMQMCEAFGENKIDVELIIPNRINNIRKDSFSYYGINKNFYIKKLPTIDLIFLNSSSVFFLIQTITFLFFTKVYLLMNKYDVLYTREQMAGLFFTNIILEIHSLPKHTRLFHLFIWKRAKKLVVLTSFIKERLISFGMSSDKISVFPDGVNLEKFDISKTKDEARVETKLPRDKKILGYVGMLRTLGMEKGINIAIESLSKIIEKEVILVLVGGTKEDIDYYRKMAINLGVLDRVIFVGRVEHSQIPIYLKAFDVLLAPFPKNEHYSFFMSPMKIFEYMASKRPIISTNLPSLEEVLSDSAILAQPGDCDSLRDNIIKVLSDPLLGENMALRAYNRVQEYTWRSRAKNILNIIK